MTSKTEECNLIVRSVRAIKLPTLTLNDTTRFTCLMKDFFPEAVMSNIPNADLENAIKIVLDREKRMIVPVQVRIWVYLHRYCHQNQPTESRGLD